MASIFRWSLIGHFFPLCSRCRSYPTADPCSDASLPSWSCHLYLLDWKVWAGAWPGPIVMMACGCSCHSPTQLEGSCTLCQLTKGGWLHPWGPDDAIQILIDFYQWEAGQEKPTRKCILPSPFPRIILRTSSSYCVSLSRWYKNRNSSYVVGMELCPDGQCTPSSLGLFLSSCSSNFPPGSWFALPRWWQVSVCLSICFYLNLR